MGKNNIAVHHTYIIVILSSVTVERSHGGIWSSCMKKTSVEDQPV